MLIRRGSAAATSWSCVTTTIVVPSPQRVRIDVVPVEPKRPLDGRANGGLVVDYENSHRRKFAGEVETWLNA